MWKLSAQNTGDLLSYGSLLEVEQTRALTAGFGIHGSAVRSRCLSVDMLNHRRVGGDGERYCGDVTEP